MKIESDRIIEKIDKNLEAISSGTTLFSDGYRTAMSQVKDIIRMEVQSEIQAAEWEDAARNSEGNNG